MPRIRILPEKVARKIAAGEVIERPASVVKELVENAFDAKAQRIEIEIEEGGLSLIRVRDDGHGMEPEDLKHCYLPHATSKIASEEDLLRIQTWGFRGEALSAIAAVSRLTISSRAQGALLGARLKVVYGKEVSFKECGHPRGTVVEVQDLFENVPARRAFLKGPRAEGSRVTETVKLLCLENPEADLRLKSNQRLSLVYERSEGRKGALAALTGLKPEDFREERQEKGPYQLEVLLSSSPHFPTTRHFYFLVNNRIIKDKILLSACLEALSLTFPKGQHPALLVALFLPPEMVDVNVHPSKAEVRFREERKVFRLVKEVLREMLAPKIEVSRPKTNLEEDLPLASKVYPTDRPSESLWETLVSEPSSLYRPKEIRAIGRLGEEFFLCEGPNGLLILDFHAAHERLIFEKLRKEYEKEGVSPQKLLLPEGLTLSAEALERLEAHRGFLERLGYQFDQVGPQEIMIRAVPALLGESAKEALRELLEEVFWREPGNILHEALARLACRAARKAGEYPSAQEIEELVSELKEKNLYTCPHGRPLFWEISLEEIKKKLGRL